MNKPVYLGLSILEHVGLKAKTYSYLIDDGSKNKKAKGTKKCVTKRKHNFENYKICLEATQLENKVSHLEKKIEVDSLKKDLKEFIKNNKLTLKAQQRFKSERHNIFTENINKIALSSNDDKRMQSIDLAKTRAYGMSKNLVSDKKRLNVTV